MGLYLGIDFGTSTNYVTRWIEETKTIEPVHLGNYGAVSSLLTIKGAPYQVW